MPTRAADDFTTIRENLERIAKEEALLCPIRGASLYDCLRKTDKCPETCVNFLDWIGPDVGT